MKRQPIDLSTIFRGKRAPSLTAPSTQLCLVQPMPCSLFPTKYYVSIPFALCSLPYPQCHATPCSLSRFAASRPAASVTCLPSALCSCVPLERSGIFVPPAFSPFPCSCPPQPDGSGAGTEWPGSAALWWGPVHTRISSPHFPTLRLPVPSRRPEWHITTREIVNSGCVRVRAHCPLPSAQCLCRQMHVETADRRLIWSQ